MLGLGLRGLGLGGMAGAGLLRLPRYVIETPATTLLDFESAAAWTAVTITAADNRTEKVQGSQSVKLTTAAGGNGHITRTFAPCQLFPSTNFLRLRIYLHSAPETVAGACIVIYVSSVVNLTKYYTLQLPKTVLAQGEWVTLDIGKEKAWAVTGGESGERHAVCADTRVCGSGTGHGG